MCAWDDQNYIMGAGTVREHRLMQDAIIELDVV